MLAAGAWTLLIGPRSTSEEGITVELGARMLLPLPPLLNVCELWLAWKFPDPRFCICNGEQ